MIKDQDAEFHVTDSDPTWAETNFFGFFNAEHKLNVGVYALFRPNLGVVSSTICMNSGRAVTPWEADFCDLRSAMPIPTPRSLLDYKLLNTLHVRCLEPNRVWHIGYDDQQGTRIDVRYEALMPAFDIHDPEIDPMCGSEGEAGKFAWGTAYNGHFDQTGHFKGSVAIRGREVPIDCVSTMDHSWGARPERGKPNMSWLHAHFSKDLAVHGIFGFDQTRNGVELWLAHGYVMERGRIVGLKAGTGQVERPQERYPEQLQLQVTDAKDRVWKLRGRALTTFPWQCWPNMISFNSLCAWEMNGLKGHGEVQDFFELPQLNALNSVESTRRPSRPL
ncbi:hypothetical protein [uncultured Methylibium sp.]|uniref:DUF7064 domain-containing protein n=1 Tax=uncultured Methylibium sp. TaxID=381093 RepID=UPI0025F3A93F|nr:hypothetical protein [uncultured Methylibium sp.]